MKIELAILPPPHWSSDLVPIAAFTILILSFVLRYAIGRYIPGADS